MWSKPVGIALVAAGCMLAAGLGAYLAVRRNAADLTTPSSAPVAALPSAASSSAPTAAVAETEAFVAQPRAAASQPSAAPSEGGVPVAAPEVVPRAERAERPGARQRATAAAPAAARRQADASRPTGAAGGSWSGPDHPGPSRAPGDVAASVPVSPGAPVVGEPVPPALLEPPGPQYEELVVAADSVIGLQIEHAISSEHARLEDPVEARVTRDVVVGGKVAIAAGTRVLGSVTLVERGGKVKERARLGIRFHTLVLGDSTRVPIQTESIFREGEPPSSESAAKIGGAAVGGAILGAILGGTKGAVIGGAAGAAGGTAAVMAGDRHAATLPAGATVTVRLTAPVTVTVER